VADSRPPDSGPEVHSPDESNHVESSDTETGAAQSAPVGLPVTPVDTGYTADGVPTFESVREKIETRVGTAIGSVELASETPEGRQVEEQYEARQRAAAERLEQIRASMRETPDPKSGQA
jgi:phage shock protein A